MNWLRRLLGSAEPQAKITPDSAATASTVTSSNVATSANGKEEGTGEALASPASTPPASSLNGVHKEAFETASNVPADDTAASLPADADITGFTLLAPPIAATDTAPYTPPKLTTGDLPTPSVMEGATRPLDEEALLILSGLTHITFGQATDIGRIRSNNQDSAYAFFASNRSSEDIPDFGLFVVADGMGGHHDGEKASALAARTVAAMILEEVYAPLVAGKDQQDSVPIGEALANAILAANTAVVERVPEGGTTLSAVVLVNDLAFIAHVGDSRVYLVGRSNIEKLTRDHSLVQRLIELDQLTPDEAAEHPQKNVLYRAIGQTEQIEVDTLTRRLPAGSRLLLCSDGLWGQVPDRNILEVVSRNAVPQEACTQLISMANSHGGIDNVTVVLVQLPG